METTTRVITDIIDMLDLDLDLNLNLNIPSYIIYSVFIISLFSISLLIEKNVWKDWLVLLPLLFPSYIPNILLNKDHTRIVIQKDLRKSLRKKNFCTCMYDHFETAGSGTQLICFPIQKLHLGWIVCLQLFLRNSARCQETTYEIESK